MSDASQRYLVLADMGRIREYREECDLKECDLKECDLEECDLEE
jgi:hypothetical protein